MWIQITPHTWLQITPIAFIIAFPVLAGLIIWVTMRFVRKANARMHDFHSETVRAETKTADAQRAAILAHQDNVRLTELADKAVSHAGHDLRVEATLEAMAGQLDFMVGCVEEQITQPPTGKHARKLKAVEDSEDESAA